METLNVQNFYSLSSQMNHKRVGSDRRNLSAKFRFPTSVWRQSWLVLGRPASLAPRAITAPDWSAFTPQSFSVTNCLTLFYIPCLSSFLVANIIAICSREEMMAVCVIPHQMPSAQRLSINTWTFSSPPFSSSLLTVCEKGPCGEGTNNSFALSRSTRLFRRTSLGLVSYTSLNLCNGDSIQCPS